MNMNSQKEIQSMHWHKINKNKWIKRKLKSNFQMTRVYLKI